MAWNSPTLKELIDRVEQDFSAKFFGVSALLRKSVLKSLAGIWAAIVWLNNLFIEWYYRNTFAHLCDPDQVKVHGNEIGVYEQAAAFARGPVKVTGGLEGEVVPQGEIINNADGDLEYQVIDDYELDENGEAIIYITSLEGGARYNQIAGDFLQFQNTQDWDTDVKIQEPGIEGGDDQEEPEPHRERVLYKKRNPPQGGAESDYVIRVTALPNITDAFITEAFPQANNVQVVLADYDKVNLTPPQPPIVADTDVALAQQELNSPGWRPLTSIPVASSNIPSNIEVIARINPNTKDNRTAAVKEIQSLFVRSGIPHGRIPRDTILGTINRAANIGEVQLDSLKQDGVETEVITLGYQQTAWLSGYSFDQLVLP